MNTLRKNNKLMALLLSVAMVVSLFPGLALWSIDKSYADDVVATVNGQSYTSLGDAKNAAREATDRMVVLQKNVEINDDFNLDVQLDLNLNGHNLTIAEGKKITITKNFAIVDRATEKGELIINGTVEVKGANLDISSLKFGQKGLVEGKPGSMKVWSNSSVYIMEEILSRFSVTADDLLNTMGNPKFIIGEVGAKVSIGEESFICKTAGNEQTRGIWIQNKTTGLPKATVTQIDLNDHAKKTEFVGDGFPIAGYSGDDPTINEVFKLTEPDAGFRFEANTDETENPYDEWLADFTVSFDKTIAKDSLGLFGKYDSWGRLGFFAPIQVEADKSIPLLNSVVSSDFWTYGNIRTIVQKFDCGVFNMSPENNNTTMTVELRIFNPEDFTDPEKIKDTSLWKENENTYVIKKIDYKLTNNGFIPENSTIDLPRLYAAGIAKVGNPIPQNMYYVTDEGFKKATTDMDVEQQTAYYAEKAQSYSITTTSAVKDSDITRLAKLEGAGQYNAEEDVTLKASVVDNFKFLGWYSGTTLVSKDNTFTFEASKDEDFVALYEREATGNVNIKAEVVTRNHGGEQEANGTVKINGGTTGPEKSEEVEVGRNVTLTATPVGEHSFFICWQNTSGAVVSTKNEFTTTVLQSKTVQAVFSNEGAALVNYKDAEENSLSSKLYFASEAPEAVAAVAPSKKGQAFTKWTDEAGNQLDDEAVKSLINDQKYEEKIGYVTLIANYGVPDHYTIKVHSVDSNGNTVNEFESQHPFGQATKISVSEQTTNGEYFQGYKLSEGGEITIKSREYSINPEETVIELWAVYGESKIEEDALLTVYTPYDAKTNAEKIGFTMAWNLPNNCKLHKAGFYYKVDGKMESFEPVITTLTGNSGSLTFNKNMKMYGDDFEDINVEIYSFVTYIKGTEQITLTSGIIGTVSSPNNQKISTSYNAVKKGE